MYIDKNNCNSTCSAVGNSNAAPAAQPTPRSDPGFAPVSPDTPSWGPPSDSAGDTVDPGFTFVPPDAPSWGPPTGGTGGGNGPVIIVPGQTVCPPCTSEGASIRFLHAAVNQPAVNIRLGSRMIINNMQFGNSTPYYLDNSSQSTLVTVTNARTGQTLYQRYINFAGQSVYTVSVINDGDGITLFSLVDTPCSYQNTSCLRAVNLSPNSGAVDVFLTEYGRIFHSLGQYDVTGYVSVRRGTYRASVSEALPCANSNAIIMANDYVECNNTRILIMDSTTLNVMNGVTYTLYLIGLAYQFPALQVLPLESDLVY